MTASQRRSLNRILTVAIAVVLLLVVLVLCLRRDKPGQPPAESADPVGDVSAPAGSDVGTQPEQTPPATEEPLPPEQVTLPPEETPADTEAPFTALKYSNGETTLSFSKNEKNVWVWDGDPAFPVDPARIEALLTAITPPAVVSAVGDPQSPETYGLDEPSVYLTATRSDRTVLELNFGDRLSDSTDRYLLRSDKPQTVFVVSGDLPAMMSVPIYHMMDLPRLPVPELDSVTALSVMGAVEFSLVAARQETEGQTVTVWLDGERDVSSLSRVQALLNALSTLKLDRCENFRPSDGAAAYWGLDDPTVTVEIVYGSGNRMSLLIGGRTLDGSGRYVRYNDEPAIYSISESALEPIMTPATFGLEVPVADDVTETEETPHEE